MINTNYEYYEDYEITRSDRWSIADRIRQSRESKNLTKTEMADLLDMTSDNYTRIESGRQLCTTTNLIKICRILGVSADYLLFAGTEDGFVAEVRMLFKGRDEKELKKGINILKAYFGTESERNE
ncbi:DNA-binding transcriptional regulator, XRE-family HTH domain [Lachnospiraceae bacterium]|nr:DNA-binding transcriptional regulator, XRE-family HTH domain [Lachnospiraceae bacterium]